MMSASLMRQMVKVSGLLVIIMGVMMAQRGLMFIKGKQMNMPRMEHKVSDMKH